jgi:hypothetical protein
MNMHTRSMGALGAVLFFALSACSAGDTDSKGKFEADLHISDEVHTKDVGLPRYAGSRPYKEDGEDSSAANIGFSTPLFGFRVVAMKFETTDRPERVAAFYRQAMAEYGSVLECRGDAPKKTKATSERDALTCDPDEPGKNNLVYKVGTEDNQRIVAIEPHGRGTRFSLVRLDMREER